MKMLFQQENHKVMECLCLWEEPSGVRGSPKLLWRLLWSRKERKTKERKACANPLGPLWPELPAYTHCFLCSSFWSPHYGRQCHLIPCQRSFPGHSPGLGSVFFLFHPRANLVFGKLVSSFLGLEISYLTKRNSLMAVFCNPPLRSLLSVESNMRKRLGHQRIQGPLTSGYKCSSCCIVQGDGMKVLPGSRGTVHLALISGARLLGRRNPDRNGHLGWLAAAC